jgi:predicted transcriptional regulator
MNIEIRKYYLIEQLMRLNEDQINKVEKFIAEVSEAELSASLDRAMQQANEGKVTPHSEVRKKYEKWL